MWQRYKLILEMPRIMGYLLYEDMLNSLWLMIYWGKIRIFELKLITDTESGIA